MLEEEGSVGLHGEEGESEEEDEDEEEENDLVVLDPSHVSLATYDDVYKPRLQLSLQQALPMKGSSLLQFTECHTLLYFRYSLSLCSL